MVDLITPDEFVPKPHELVLRNGTPDTIAGWKALADGLLTNQSVRLPPQPGDLVTLRLDLQVPARLLQVGRDGGVRVATTSGSPSCRSGWTPIAPATWTSRTASIAIDTRAAAREDVDTIRETNNAIFDDIFWVHLAYSTADRRDRMSTRAPGHGAPLCRPPRRLRGYRPRTPCAGGRNGVRGRLDGWPRI